MLDDIVTSPPIVAAAERVNVGDGGEPAVAASPLGARTARPCTKMALQKGFKGAGVGDARVLRQTHLNCGSSSEPIMASSSAARSSSPTFRTSLHLPSLSQNKLRDVKLPDNIVLDSPPPYGNIVLDSPPPYGSSSTVETAPITIGVSASPIDANKKLSVLEIAAPPSERKVFKDWDRNVEEDNIMLTQTQENVACPRCGRVFPPDKHLQFLDHFDECQEYGKPPRVACDN
ncbi:hypothetical protein B566_EDAN011785 [Ephemera danica]|nr:hypothetical protein B566_EDAN011785 [Ephemera danica]